MKKKYEKPFIMKLDIPNTDVVAESTIPTETWECTTHVTFPIEFANEFWTKKVSRCTDEFAGYTHY